MKKILLCISTKIFLLFTTIQNSVNSEKKNILIFVHGTNINLPWQAKWEELKNKTGIDKKIKIGHGEDSLIIGQCQKGEFHAFSWSGGLSNFHRKRAAKNLLKDIKELKIRDKDYTFSFVTHSHGINVIAEFITLLKEEAINDIQVEDVFSGGGPIGKITEDAFNLKKNDREYYVKNIFNFWNKDDLLQGADFTFQFPKAFKKIKLSRQGIYNIQIKNLKELLNKNISLWEKIKDIPYSGIIYFLFGHDGGVHNFLSTDNFKDLLQKTKQEILEKLPNKKNILVYLKNDPEQSPKYKKISEELDEIKNTLNNIPEGIDPSHYIITSMEVREDLLSQEKENILKKIKYFTVDRIEEDKSTFLDKIVTNPLQKLAYTLSWKKLAFLTFGLLFFSRYKKKLLPPSTINKLVQNLRSLLKK